ncbi:hypothetical protein N7466_005580 [Penicillium verhagenii]|uniref:uncharacterized protein n=1 Tax=Penicillium verhagenii TaxID=1562060 RepID=UPI002544EF0C|nr:uncharacterized protein N7466_005580 [Penicillium verhagenii]KAJ5930087.1 hypothetical protein N7466_005580 [Penicillium verhagenii]
MADIDVDEDVKGNAFTTKNYRDIYPAIDPTRPELSQTGKVVVITGGSRGLGRLAFAASFARAGAGVIVLIGRSATGLEDTEKLINEISPDTQVLRFPLDITDQAAVETVFRDIVAQVGAPHVLINNAGNLAPLQRTFDSTLDSWWDCQEINIKGTYIVTKAFIGATVNATAPINPANPTSIITVTSLAAHGTAPGMGAYSLAKLALTKLTAYIGSEHPTITSVSLDPGVVPTDMARAVPYLAEFMLDTPELVGGAAVWLSSGDKRFLSGRYVSANWDVEELESRKDEIVDGNQLKFGVKGNFASNATVVKST